MYYFSDNFFNNFSYIFSEKLLFEAIFRKSEEEPGNRLKSRSSKTYFKY